MGGQQREARPPGWMCAFRIDLPERRDERRTHSLPDFTFAPSQRDLTHQTVQADGVVRDRQVSPIGDAFALD
jgi:hypothetical protein